MRRTLATLAVLALALAPLSACDCAGPAGSAPVVRIVTPADGTLFQSMGPHSVLGQVVDAEEVIPTERIVWKSDRDGPLAQGTAASILLTVGEHRLSLEATDRSGNVGTAQITVRVITGFQLDGGGTTDGGVDPDGGMNSDGGNADPTVSILSPANNALFDLGMPIPLSGMASDPEDGVLTGASLVWTSDRMGVLGSGAQLTFNNAALGAHQLALTATDNTGRSALASVSITVVQPGTNRPPMVTLTSPGNGAQFIVGTSVTLQGSATDLEDGALTGASLTWTSSRDGTLGTGATLMRTLSQGVHVLTLTALDSQSASGSASVTVSVNQANNLPPMVSITQPTMMQTVFAATSITFAGMGTDPEDGALIGASLAWSSSLDGALGTGSPLSTSALTVGDHVITLVGTDSGGNSATATVVVRVLPANRPPVVTITAPANNTSVTSGTMLGFTGTAIDPEDGALTGASIRWSSSRDGTLGTGSPLNTSSLSVGVHTITLSATDSGGQSASASISVTVTMSMANVPPIARLTGPTSGTTVDTLTFDGSTSSDSDGTIASWRFDFGDGSPAVTSTTVMNASHVYAMPGTYTVTLTVTDDRGAMASTTLVVTITAFVRVPVIALPAIADVGTACQIATPGSRVFVAWTSGVHPAVFFGERISGVITPELVDGLGFQVGGVVRQLISMKVEANGTPHLVYVRDNTVMYATKVGASWTKERVDTTLAYSAGFQGDLTTSPSLTLNGTTPVILYATGNSVSSTRPAIATRTGPGVWSQVSVTVPNFNAGERHLPIGEVAVDSMGRVLFPASGYDASFNPLQRLVAWTSALTSVVTLTPQLSNRASTVLTPAGHLLMSGATGVYDVTVAATFTASTFTLSPAELGALSQHAIAADSNGWPRVLSAHGSNLEAIRSLGAPGFWEWTFLGSPVTAGILDVSVDGADQTRACFIRSGNLMVY